LHSFRNQPSQNRVNLLVDLAHPSVVFLEKEVSPALLIIKRQQSIYSIGVLARPPPKKQSKGSHDHTRSDQTKQVQ
jgi:hypothetical protein